LDEAAAVAVRDNDFSREELFQSFRSDLTVKWELSYTDPVILDISARRFAVPEGTQFRELIRRVRERDQDAAQELVQRYENAIRRVVRIHLRDTRMRRVLDSMDICQSVLASFFIRTALGQYELESPEQLLNLLTTITRNKLTNQANRLRAQRRDIRRETASDDQAALVLDQASDPSEQASAREILEKVRARLDAPERYLAEQRSLGRSWKELAEELGGTDVALRKKLTRALDRVMAELGLDETSDA
jgi:RNA polymerase sigma-70 factor (ECF subfamily)